MKIKINIAKNIAAISAPNKDIILFIFNIKIIKNE
jgi:hypothetical protein